MAVVGETGVRNGVSWSWLSWSDVHPTGRQCDCGRSSKSVMLDMSGVNAVHRKRQQAQCGTWWTDRWLTDSNCRAQKTWILSSAVRHGPKGPIPVCKAWTYTKWILMPPLTQWKNMLCLVFFFDWPRHGVVLVKWVWSTAYILNVLCVGTECSQNTLGFYTVVHEGCHVVMLWNPSRKTSECMWRMANILLVFRLKVQEVFLCGILMEYVVD